jgi:hypothetical protein
MNINNCFSGECGFCNHCCDYLSYQNKNNSPSEEYNNRAKDMIKFYSKSDIESYEKEYNQKLKEIINRTDYVSPIDKGYLSNKKRINNTFYTLKENYHKLLCDDTMCRIMFHNTHDHLKKKYSKLPIYTRENDKYKFCAVCIERISDYRNDLCLQIN